MDDNEVNRTDIDLDGGCQLNLLLSLLAPFIALQLSALDNLKVAYSIAIAAGIEVSAYEIHLSLCDIEPSTIPSAPHMSELCRYALRINTLHKDQVRREETDAILATTLEPIDGYCWLDCGRSNDYAASITVLSNEKTLRIVEQIPQQLSVLSEHHIQLLCMDNAHFDHC